MSVCVSREFRPASYCRPRTDRLWALRCADAYIHVHRLRTPMRRYHDFTAKVDMSRPVEQKARGI